MERIDKNKIRGGGLGYLMRFLLALYNKLNEIVDWINEQNKEQERYPMCSDQPTQKEKS